MRDLISWALLALIIFSIFLLVVVDVVLRLVKASIKASGYNLFVESAEPNNFFNRLTFYISAKNQFPEGIALKIQIAKVAYMSSVVCLAVAGLIFLSGLLFGFQR